MHAQTQPTNKHRASMAVEHTTTTQHRTMGMERTAQKANKQNIPQLLFSMPDATYGVV